jgi:hypothetical protein
MSYSSHYYHYILGCYRYLLSILLLGMLYGQHHHQHKRHHSYILGGVSAQPSIEFNLYKTPYAFIGPIHSGSIINLSTLNSRNLTIVATNTNIRNIKFWFDGSTIRSERVAPYAIAGDIRGQLLPFTNLTNKGNHTIMAKVYNINGTIVTTKSIRFVMDDFIHQQQTPSKAPSHIPSIYPTRMPSYVPSIDPTNIPSNVPSNRPSKFPSITPTTFPSRTPSIDPSMYPSLQPSTAPTDLPIVQIHGELRKWHKVTFAFNGPYATETDTYIRQRSPTKHILYQDTLPLMGMLLKLVPRVAINGSVILHPMKLAYGHIPFNLSLGLIFLHPLPKLVHQQHSMVILVHLSFKIQIKLDVIIVGKDVYYMLGNIIYNLLKRVNGF